MNEKPRSRAERRAEARAAKNYSMPNPWKVLHAAFSPADHPLEERKVFLAMFTTAMGMSRQQNATLQEMLDQSEPSTMELMRDLAVMRGG